MPRLGDDDLFGDDDDMMDDGGEGLLNEFDISTKTTAPEGTFDISMPLLAACTSIGTSVGM